MILTCPSCGTRYVVKDGAIPPGGRTVRCAQCKHSWHQDPEVMELEEPVAAASIESPTEPEAVPPAAAEPVQHIPEHGTAEEWPEPAHSHPLGEDRGSPYAGELGDHGHPDTAASWNDPDASPLPDTDVQPTASSLASESWDQEAANGPEVAPDAMPPEAAVADEPYPEDVVPTEPEPPTFERTSHPLRAGRAEADDLYSPFAARDEEPEPRRRWPMLLGLLLLVVAAVAAAVWFLAPTELKSRLGIAQANGDTPLLLQVQQHSRQQLASGNQLLEVSGQVINPTEETQSVPPLQAQLRSLEQQVVYKWTIPPPSPRLAPGGVVSFNSAQLNIPPTAACLDVYFGAPKPQPECRDPGRASGA